MMSTYTVKINNCNSIDSAEISISRGLLNIKYGPNGLGKSSIARAITSSVANDGSLQKLKPFKHRDTDGKGNPSVTGVEDIKSVLVFDDVFVSQFAFQKDEVLKNSFKVFIETKGFLSTMEKIENLLSEVKSAFDGNENLAAAITDLKELRGAFTLTKNGTISKTSKAYKAFGSGNNIENIPDNLKLFTDFLKSDQPSAWILWQTNGNAFTNLSENCPYCATNISNSVNQTIAKSVADTYDHKTIEHLTTLQLVIAKLGKYFESSCRTKLEKITKSKTELTPEEYNFLSSLQGDVVTLIEKLEGLHSMSFFKLRDVENIEDEVNKLRIYLDLLANLNSEDTKILVNPINEKLNNLSKKIGNLKGQININKDNIEKSIVSNEKSINNFLKSAGYKYSVDIKPEANSYQMKLIHNEFKKHIETASQHLSYGEKNAFAMVLFMHQVLYEKPDLVVLDDPVSSFDKTKKFAILNALFRGAASLRNMTVLMLTHDIEPAIDIISILKKQFQDPKPTAFFLSSKRGVVSELEIVESNIKTFANICSDNIKNLEDDFIKCIYLRRHFEIINDTGNEYNYLSNLFHGRETPTIKQETGHIPMNTQQIECAETGIKNNIPNFNYSTLLAAIKDKLGMIERFKNAISGYEKIQLFRIFKSIHISGNKDDDSVLQKFINESFHIENEYVMQLNPHTFDNVPEYLIQECEQIMAKSSQDAERDTHVSAP